MTDDSPSSAREYERPVSIGGAVGPRAVAAVLAGQPVPASQTPPPTDGVA